jgi:hypothetical protein
LVAVTPPHLRDRAAGDAAGGVMVELIVIVAFAFLPARPLAYPAAAIVWLGSRWAAVPLWCLLQVEEI